MIQNLSSTQSTGTCVCEVVDTYKQPENDEAIVLLLSLHKEVIVQTGSFYPREIDSIQKINLYVWIFIYSHITQQILKYTRSIVSLVKSSSLDHFPCTIQMFPHN